MPGEDPASRYARPARCEISASGGGCYGSLREREREQPIKYTLASGDASSSSSEQPSSLFRVCVSSGMCVLIFVGLSFGCECDWDLTLDDGD